MVIILCNFAPPGQVCENCLFIGFYYSLLGEESKEMWGADVA